MIFQSPLSAAIADVICAASIGTEMDVDAFSTALDMALDDEGSFFLASVASEDDDAGLPFVVSDGFAGNVVSEGDVFAVALNFVFASRVSDAEFNTWLMRFWEDCLADFSCATELDPESTRTANAFATNTLVNVPLRKERYEKTADAIEKKRAPPDKDSRRMLMAVNSSASGVVAPGGALGEAIFEDGVSGFGGDTFCVMHYAHKKNCKANVLFSPFGFLVASRFIFYFSGFPVQICEPRTMVVCASSPSKDLARHEATSARRTITTCSTRKRSVRSPSKTPA